MLFIYKHSYAHTHPTLSEISENHLSDQSRYAFCYPSCVCLHILWTRKSWMTDARTPLSVREQKKRPLRQDYEKE